MTSWFDNLDLTATEEKWLITGAVFLTLFVIRWLVLRVVRRRVEDVTVWYRARKVATYVAFIIAVVIVARVWLKGGGFGTYIGFLTAGLAIALSDVIKNLAGWAFILLRRPFRIGDRIQIGEWIGDVVDLRVFRFSMLEVGNWVHADQSTGRIMHVPNGLVFTQPVANYTEGFAYIWHEIEVLVTFESDWEAAERVVRAAVEEHAVHHDPMTADAELRRTAESYQISYTHITPAVYLTVKDSGVLLTGRILTRARQRRGLEDNLWRSILKGFEQEPNVALAYPTIRTYLPDTLRVER